MDRKDWQYDPASREEAAERLELWAQGLELVVKEEGWDFACWVKGENEPDEGLLAAFNRDECGTAGCAGGWLPKLFPSVFVHREGHMAGGIPIGYPMRIGAPSNWASLASGIAPTRNWFGLSQSMWQQITEPNTYATGPCTPKEAVIERIRAARSQILERGLFCEGMPLF